jgi:hypothetical protein
MKLSDSEFMKAAQHQTAGDHTKLADHYAAQAIEHDNAAKISDESAAHVSGHHASESGLDKELRHYAAHSREVAIASRALVEIHRELVKEHQKVPVGA